MVGVDFEEKKSITVRDNCRYFNGERTPLSLLLGFLLLLLHCLLLQ